MMNVVKMLLLLCLTLGQFITANAEDIQASYLEAQAILSKMHQAIIVLDKSFKKEHPENLADSEWIQRKLENMVMIDQLMRRVLVENILTKTWDRSVKRAFLIFFFNLDANTLNENTLGYAQRNDLFSYREFKHLLEMSPKLSPYGWPVVSKFGKESDYYAFIIVQHGKAYDKKWQMKTLLPRLKKLAQNNETSRIVPLWLENSSLDYMRSLPPMLELEGGMWSAMIPEIYRLSSFFQTVPYLLSAPKLQAFKL